MQLRPVTSGDLDALREIDGTIESTEYLHLEQTGEGMQIGWSLQSRPLRQKLIQGNPLADEIWFAAKQIATGADEGIALLAEHEGLPVGLLIAQPQHEARAMQILDLRIDYDHRRQGVATAMIYQLIAAAGEAELRAVAAITRTNNFPANQFLLKSSFDLAGLDTRRDSNHDVVKESASLLWYASLD
jgi:ribosomal protein S18 acetylase RimI-like enzyme